MSEEFDVKEIKPGILVTELVSLKGGIHYDRENQESYFEDEAHIREWKTISRIDNVEERQNALRLRSKFYQAVRRCCIKTPIGLICKQTNKTKLQEALQNIRSERDQFNNLAKTCRINTHYACFDLKTNNHEAISAILDQIALVAEEVDNALIKNEEIILRSSPKRWLKNMKVEAILLLPENERNAIVARARAELIRKAIKDVKGIEKLLPKDAEQKTLELIKECNSIAKKLCNKVERHNNKLNEVLEEVDLSGIRKNRAAFVMAAMKADRRTTQLEEEIPLVNTRKLTMTSL